MLSKLTIALAGVRIGAAGLRLPTRQWLTIATVLVSLPFSLAMAAVGPTVREVIEFNRIIQPVRYDDDTLQTQISPDGEQAFIVTRRGDVASDRNRFEILLMDVSPSRLAAAVREGARPAPTRLLAVETAQDNDDVFPSLADARWIGNRTIVFRARMNDEPFQAYRIDVLTKRVTQLTHAPLGVVSFDVQDDLRRVAFLTLEPNPAVPPGTRSVVAGAQSFWSLHGQPDDFETQIRKYRFYLAEAGSRQPARPLGPAFLEAGGVKVQASFSPDGRWVLIPQLKPERQRDWARLYPQVAQATAAYSPALSKDPRGYYSRPSSYVTRQLMAYRLDDGSERPVIDAPSDFIGSGTQARVDRVWQKGAASVVIAGTYLPLSGAAAAADVAAASASHIIEYWPDSGAWKPIAALRQRLKDLVGISTDGSEFTAIDGEQRRRFRRNGQGSWDEINAATGATGDPVDGRRAWRLQVKQALNQPADIVAVGPGKEEVRLTDLNPQFDAATWGTMKPYVWKDAKGRLWHGGLMVPADFDPKARYPLVIQTYGFSASRFYRDGANTYDGGTSGFAGRAFLREGILVLALPWRSSEKTPTDEHGSILEFSDGVRGAIDALVSQGLVDRDRIGIVGWSATGVRVLNLVTFTDAPIRAASMIDGDSNTLFSMTITYAVRDGIQATKESANEGLPFGDSWERWIRNDPSLHTDCIRAALRIESYGTAVRNNWDIYALLRRQYRPVEMIRFPQAAHALARPSERMISLQGNVDWYRFWLKDERRSEPILPSETAQSLGNQYERWEEMKVLKAAADAKPRCPRHAHGS